MAWTIEIDEHAIRQLQRVGTVEALRIRDFLRDRMAVLDNPRLQGKGLKGTKLDSLWRYRGGDYRILRLAG